MNIEMPLMDGIEAAVEIRKLEAARNYPYTYILGLSASPEKKGKCLECGMDDFFATPVSMSDLALLIKKKFETL